MKERNAIAPANWKSKSVQILKDTAMGRENQIPGILEASKQSSGIPHSSPFHFDLGLTNESCVWHPHDLLAATLTSEQLPAPQEQHLQLLYLMLCCLPLMQ